MKTLLLKSNFLTKQSVVLGAAVLTVAFLLVPFARAEEPPRLMPTGHGGGQPDDRIQPFDPNPSAPDSLTRQFITYGKDSDGNTVPLKTLRITNNTADTVYPIMRDENSNILKSDPGVGLYDPYDPPKKEYRGYIGYERGGKFYFGLQKGESILVSLPLVFWNAGRIAIGTDGKYLTPSGLPNPLRYDPNAHRSIARAETGSGNISDGVVMWYRAEIAKGPTDDSEDQLAEWTVRDHVYLVNPEITRKTNREIPDTQLVTLMNYDVSNVDNLYLPLAMAANDVWVVPQRSTGAPPNENRDGWESGSDPDVYGWVGADNTIAALQTQIRAFTADDNKLLGKYFKDSKGWPFYNIPNPPSAPRKIPSGANVFAQSPIRGLGVVSSYSTGEWDTDKFMLSSGGTEPRAATIGWAGTPPDGDPPGQPILHLNRAESAKIAFLQVGYLVKGVPPNQPPTPNPIQDGTKILEIVNGEPGTVKLSKNLVNSSKACAFTFSRPVDDYVSDAMIRLWYSWAQYYLKHWNDGKPNAPTKETPIIGSIKENTGTLTFTQPHPELVKGMAVKGPGLDDAQTEKGVHQGDALILEIAGDTVILSQVANKTSDKAEFKVRPPQSLLYTPAKEGDPGFPLIGNNFVFGNEPPWHNPYEFSQQVYMIMASMNQISEPNNDSVSKFMQDIVGANMGFIFNNEAKKVFDAQEIIAMIRDMIKSVLRGVTDFTNFPDEVIDKKHTRWYPDPSERTGNQDLNVFNLDPFVWFVHVKLGFSGYGFSVDDDTADIGAGGASQLQLTVTGTGGLKNTDPWTIQAPYGPVKKVSCLYSGPSPTNGDTIFQDIKEVSGKVSDPNTPITITAPAGRLLSNGDTVVIENVPGDAGINANGTFKIGNLTRDTFDLFDEATGKMPVASSGACTAGAGKCGRWSYPLHPYIDSGDDLKKVFYRVTGDDALGTFLGTFVSVNDVDRNKKNGIQFRIWRLGKQKIVEQTVGRLLLDANLTDADGTSLPAGTYDFTFFGAAETGTALGGAPPFSLGPIREDIHEEMDRIQKRLHRLEKKNSDSKKSARKSRWLEMRIAVLTARLQYPTDEVLQQLEQAVEARQSLGRKALRQFLDQLNTRIAELQSPGG
jgi:hypothetical protein